MDFQHAGSFTHNATRLSCPWGRDPWGTRNISFVSCPYSFPQHCMPYRLSVGAGLFTNLFWLVIKTHERVTLECNVFFKKETILTPFGRP